jgi:CRP-like cAMP-binding protein
MPDPEVTEFFERMDITRGWSAEELRSFVDSLDRHEFGAGATILEEGGRNDRAYFLFGGRAAVSKRTAAGTERFSINQLSPGDCFGELSFIDDTETSASVEATESCVAYSVSKAAAISLPFYAKLLANIARSIVTRLRKTNEAHVRSLVAEAEQLSLRNKFGIFYIVTALVLSVGPGLPRLFRLDQKMGYEFILGNWAILLLVALPLFLFIHRMQMPVSSFGVTRRNWKRSLLEGLALSAILTPPVFLARQLTLAPGEAFASWAKLPVVGAAFWIYVVTYFFHCMLQEFAARGILQSSLRIFLSDSHFLVPILVVSMMFGVGHLHLGLLSAVFTFLISFAFGLIYHRHGTLLGVTVVHYVLGVLAIAFGLV